MEKNYLDILTIILKYKIKEKDIPYIKQAVAIIDLTEEDEEKQEKFWEYFKTF